RWKATPHWTPQEPKSSLRRAIGKPARPAACTNAAASSAKTACGSMSMETPISTQRRSPRQKTWLLMQPGLALAPEGEMVVKPVGHQAQQAGHPGHLPGNHLVRHAFVDGRNRFFRKPVHRH